MAFVFAQILLDIITNVVISRNKINPTIMIPKEMLDRFDAALAKNNIEKKNHDDHKRYQMIFSDSSRMAN